MSLIPSLLRAIVTVGGHSLVLHAGEKPYVSSPAGQIDLAGGGMTTEAIADVISQLLPHESQQVLTQFGAVQHDLRDLPDFPGEQFRVLATNEGNAVGLEIRRLEVEPAAPASALRPDTPQRRQSDRPADVRQDRGRSGAMPAVALPLPEPTAPPLIEAPAASRTSQEAGLLERLLHAAFVEGATALYLSSGQKPWMRADDDLKVLEGHGPLTAAQIDAMLTRAPDGGASSDANTREWFWEFPELGRVRCTVFRDHRGPGLALRSVPTRPPTSRQLGLSREIEALTMRAEGLIVVAAPHRSAAHVLTAALVDVINRTRRVHVISVEREVTAIHESEASLISQREAGRSLDRVLELARGALREQPDVLVLDTVLNADLLSLAIDAAHSGHLVLCATRAGSVAGVFEDFLGLYPAMQRQKLQIALSRTLVGIVAETSDPGSRAASDVRELLVNTPESAYLIAEGRFAGLGVPDRRR